MDRRPPMTAVSATAPEGGCTQRSANMPPMANDTASADASTGSPIIRAQVTPTTDATRLPPMMDHGCASGLAGTANSSTAEAPIGATSRGTGTGPSGTQCIAAPVNRIPTSAPAAERRRSVQRTVTGAGAKLASQRSRARRYTMGSGMAAIACGRPHRDKGGARGPGWEADYITL